MSIGDIIVLGLIAAAVVTAAVRICKKRSTCGCGCSGCTARCDRARNTKEDR